MKRFILRLVILIAFLACSYSTNAQDYNVFVLLQRGTARLTNNMTKVSLELSPGKKEVVLPYSKLFLDRNAIAIIYNINGFEEIGGKNEESYHAREISKILKKKTPTTATVRFFNYLNYTYSEMHKSENRKGSVVGAATRGGNNSEFSYSPDDSLLIINDSVRLTWTSDKYFRLIDNLIVVNLSNRDTIYNSYPADSTILLNDLRAGEYHWSARFRSKEGKSLSMANIFFVPADSIKISLRNEIEEFSELISPFSPETRETLLNDLLLQKKIFYH